VLIDDSPSNESAEEQAVIAPSEEAKAES